MTKSLLIFARCAALIGTSGILAQPNRCNDLKPLPLNEEDFNEPDWETIIEIAFPTWAIPESGCPRLVSVGGQMQSGFETFPTPESGKFNPCYYTKAFNGLDPLLGGYPTPIDTQYPYEFAAPFLRQPGDGSVHHCPVDSENDVNIAACPKLGNTCGKDCAVISEEHGIGHIPPFVPLAAIQKSYQSCEDHEEDICATWFDYELSGCNMKKSAMDALVYKYFGEVEDNTIRFQPPILLGGAPSSTYFRLEYGGESPACDDGSCRGPHYCSKEVADADIIWGDFCPYVHTGENAGKYRHPHIALAALELWIANQCMPDRCASKWLDSPNGQGYGNNSATSTSITWSEMENNEDPIAQPSVPYVWPNSGNGVYPGHNLYEGKSSKPVPGNYVTDLVGAVTSENQNSRCGSKALNLDPYGCLNFDGCVDESESACYYFRLDSAVPDIPEDAWGCIGPEDRSTEKGTKLKYLECFDTYPVDDSFFWTLDNNGKVHSKLDYGVCWQAGHRTSSSVSDGSHVRLYPCDDDSELQKFDVSDFIDGGFHGPIRFGNDLCVVSQGVHGHVGVDPIILKECDKLEEARFGGWEGDSN